MKDRCPLERLWLSSWGQLAARLAAAPPRGVRPTAPNWTATVVRADTCPSSRMPTVQGVGHAGRPMHREADVSLTLYLVRHGETVYNVERRLQGWCDSPLTPDGAAGVRA